MKKISKRNRHSLKSGLSVLISIAVLGCTQTHSLNKPNNADNVFYGKTVNQTTGTHFNQETPQERVFSVAKDCTDRKDFAAPFNYRVDQPMNFQKVTAPSFVAVNNSNFSELPLSTGDLVEVLIENGEGFSGRYVISPMGNITIPLLPNIASAGITPRVLSEKIELALIRANIFQPSVANVAVQVLNWSPVEIAVKGAVFQPGRVLINSKRPSALMAERVAAYGDISEKRLLSEAIRAASGVRPDAKLEQVILIRNGWQIQVDLTGILTGDAVTDYPLIAGDQVIVPSTGCFQSHLVRPSQITPKGFRVFMSNLIDSANSNSGAGVGRYSTNIPYGTRLLQAAVSANCVGGKVWTNAPRTVLLASNHPITGETQVIERSVEQLMRNAMRDDINPFLMPNDAVACYDSHVTNLRSVANTLVDIVAPFKLF